MEYGGFYIGKPVGNNYFSYEQRKNKKIYVPKLIKASMEDIVIGNEIVFDEIEDDKEFVCIGLANMYEIDLNQGNTVKKVYVFDNHNHAFFFWCLSLLRGDFKKGLDLVHVDQHKDTRLPEHFDVDINDIEDVSMYTNEVLNVGSFIKPALYHKIFKNLHIIDSTYSLETNLPSRYVLDIDLDFFSKDMDYIPFDYKMEKVIDMINRSEIITVATSPYFIEQDRALSVLKMLFGIEKIRKL